ncbi:chaperone protein DnaJ 2-like [Anopheles stephensi]|uniref:chaperone protein DnaJ 2-like n=1 Tax=Anopheles stephensi TaxID=30069 RepID=UPI001658BE35|nr:chaperone protein DnaJ 2-like [Anopheles stephensi]
MISASLYAVLGVEREASRMDIIAAYQNLAPYCHPNSTLYAAYTFPIGNLTQQQYWHAINEAVVVLTVEELRVRYDLNMLQTCYPGNAFFGNCDEIFQCYFRNSCSVVVESPSVANGNQWIARNLETLRPTSDITITVAVDLEEMFTGTQKTLTYPRMRYIDGRSLTQMETVIVTIMPHMRHGMSLLFRGLGHENELGQGNLVVVLHVNPHPIFIVSGNDLLHKMAVPLSIAMLGGEVRVQTIDSQWLTILVQPASQSAQRQVIRFEGQGLHASGDVRGDMIVTITATIPRVPPHLRYDAHRILRAIEEYGNWSAIDEQ